MKHQIMKIQEKERKRLENLEKLHQKEKASQRKLKQEHKQLIERMKNKEELRKQKEQERYEKLKQQEEGYKQKRNQILQKQRSDEQFIHAESDRLLNKIQSKIDSSFEKEQMMLQTMSAKARKFNDIVYDKLTDHKKHSTEKEMELLHQKLKQEIDSKKRLEKLHKSCTHLWDSIRKKKEEKKESISNNKKLVEKARKQKVKELISNQNKSQKAIEEHQKRVQHGIMLKQELRKLKQLDVEQVKERNRRLNHAKKEEVMQKHSRSTEMIKAMKQMQDVMVKNAIQEDVRDMKHRFDVADTFMGITKGIISPIKKNKIGIKVDPEILKESDNEED